jgi:hypothetical protein
MSAHDTYEASIKAAEATKAATLAASEATRQLGADPKAASVAKLNSAFLAEQAILRLGHEDLPHRSRRFPEGC